LQPNFSSPKIQKNGINHISYLTFTAGALNILIAPANAAGVALLLEIILLAARVATEEGKRIMMTNYCLIITV